MNLYHEQTKDKKDPFREHRHRGGVEGLGVDDRHLPLALAGEGIGAEHLPDAAGRHTGGRPGGGIRPEVGGVLQRGFYGREDRTVTTIQRNLLILLGIVLAMLYCAHFASRIRAAPVPIPEPPRPIRAADLHAVRVLHYGGRTWQISFAPDGRYACWSGPRPDGGQTWWAGRWRLDRSAVHMRECTYSQTLGGSAEVVAGENDVYLTLSWEAAVRTKDEGRRTNPKGRTKDEGRRTNPAAVRTLVGSSTGWCWGARVRLEVRSTKDEPEVSTKYEGRRTNPK